jgi:lysozyme
MKTQYLETIKQFEGFTAKAKWDFAQESNGYGTKALYPGEVIGRAEAEQRFAAEIATAKAAVTRFAPGLDEGTAAALTSLTFNAGPGWMRSGLGATIKAGDLEGAKQVFVQYVRAGGQRLAGLEARRAAEVQWIGQPQSTALHVNRDGASAVTSAVAVAGAKDVPSLREGEPAADTALARRRALPDSASVEALAKALLLETIGIVLAARRSQNDRDDHDRRRGERV